MWLGNLFMDIVVAYPLHIFLHLIASVFFGESGAVPYGHFDTLT